MKLKCVSNYRKGMMNGYDFRDAFEVGKSYSFVTSHYAYYVYSDRKGWVKVYIADFIVVFVPEDGVVDPESFQGQFIKETMKLAAKKLKMSVPTVQRYFTGQSEPASKALSKAIIKVLKGS